MKFRSLTGFYFLLILAAMLMASLATARFYVNKIRNIENIQALDDCDNTHIIVQILNRNIPKQLNNNNRIINNIVCHSIDIDSIDMQGIIKDKPKLILYGGSMYCNMCIDYHLTFINELSEKLDFGVIILFKNISTRELQIIKSNNGLNDSVLIISSNDVFGLPLEEENDPCYFIVNPDRSIVDIFYPVKGLPSYNKLYYDYLFDTNKYHH